MFSQTFVPWWTFDAWTFVPQKTFVPWRIFIKLFFSSLNWLTLSRQQKTKQQYPSDTKKQWIWRQIQVIWWSERKVVKILTMKLMLFLDRRLSIILKSSFYYRPPHIYISLIWNGAVENGRNLKMKLAASDWLKDLWKLLIRSFLQYPNFLAYISVLEEGHSI